MIVSIKLRREKSRIHILPQLDFDYFTCGNLTVYSFKIGWIKYYIDLFWSKEQKGEEV